MALLLGDHGAVRLLVRGAGLLVHLPALRHLLHHAAPLLPVLGPFLAHLGNIMIKMKIKIELRKDSGSPPCRPGDSPGAGPCYTSAPAPPGSPPRPPPDTPPAPPAGTPGCTQSRTCPRTQSHISSRGSPYIFVLWLWCKPYIHH